MLHGWDGHLNVLLRKRVSRHLEQCPVVAFKIAVPQADAAGLAVTLDRGSLAAGQSVTITVSTVGNGPPDY
jgi:hypothetical protein